MAERRTRRTTQQWLELVAQQKASGLSVAAFARQENVAYQSLWNWCRKSVRPVESEARAMTTRDTKPSLPEFIELGISAPADQPTTTSMPVNDWLVELELAGGLTLRVRQPT